jgi:hypothetical protein
MSGQDKIWSDIYQLFSDNGRSKMFRIFLSTMFSAGHVGSHYNNASTTENNTHQS